MDTLQSTIATGVRTVGDGQDHLETSVANILNAIILSLGSVAVVVVLVGGITYMTSSGDTNKVKKAKDTILYGVIGLVVCVLAFAIVNFVILNIIGGPKDSSNTTQTDDGATKKEGFINLTNNFFMNNN